MRWMRGKGCGVVVLCLHFEDNARYRLALDASKLKCGVLEVRVVLEH